MSEISHQDLFTSRTHDHVTIWSPITSDVSELLSRAHHIAKTCTMYELFSRVGTRLKSANGTFLHLTYTSTFEISLIHLHNIWYLFHLWCWWTITKTSYVCEGNVCHFHNTNLRPISFYRELVHVQSVDIYFLFEIFHQTLNTTIYLIHSKLVYHFINRNQYYLKKYRAIIGAILKYSLTVTCWDLVQVLI